MTSIEMIGLSSSDLTAEISTLGAELQSLATADGRELQWDGNPKIWRGRAPILFPIIGLLENGRYCLDDKSYEMPKHGFARTSIFEMVSSTSSRAKLRLAASPATLAIYPFDFQFDMDFELIGTTITLHADIVNKGREPMLASFGFHPALQWPLPFGHPRADHRILFEEPEPAPVRRIDKDGFLRPDPVPSPVVGDMLMLRDDLFVDDALIFDRLSSRSVRYGAPSGPQLHARFDDFPTLGIWTKPGADFICIEPWHGFSDPVGFTGDIRDKPGIFAIAPLGSRQYSMSLTLER